MFNQTIKRGASQQCFFYYEILSKAEGVCSEVRPSVVFNVRMISD